MGKIFNNVGSESRNKQMGARQTKDPQSRGKRGRAQAADDGLIPRFYKKLLKT